MLVGAISPVSFEQGRTTSTSIWLRTSTALGLSGELVRNRLRDPRLGQTAGCIPNRDAGMRVLPEIGFFGRHLVCENYGARPETSSLYLQAAIVICRCGVSPTRRRDRPYFEVVDRGRSQKNDHTIVADTAAPETCCATAC